MDGKLNIVFLDIVMPHLDGLEAARKIREKDTSLAIILQLLGKLPEKKSMEMKKS